MRRAALFTLLLVPLWAQAHADRSIPIGDDGHLYELPAEFGEGRLGVTFYPHHGKPAIGGVMLAVGKNQTELPGCLTRLLKTTAMADIQASASWNHDEASSPYYLKVAFPQPGVSAGTAFQNGYVLLFNLRSARLIRMTRAVTTARGKVVQYYQIDLSRPCSKDNERVAGNWQKIGSGAP